MKNLSSLLKCIIYFCLALVTFLSLSTFIPADINFLAYPISLKINNAIGIIGAYIGFSLFFAFGYAAFFIPFYLLFMGIDAAGIIRFKGLSQSKTVSVCSFFLFIIFLSTFLGVFSGFLPLVFGNPGGFSGLYLSLFFKKYLGLQGSFIVLSLLLVITSFLLFGFFFADIARAIKSISIKIIAQLKAYSLRRNEAKDRLIKQPQKQGKIRKPSLVKNSVFENEIKPEIKVYTPNVNTTVSKISEEDFYAGLPSEKKISQTPVRKNKEAFIKQDTDENAKKYDPATYKLPSKDLIKLPPSFDMRELKDNIEDNIKILQETLADFGVEVRVVSVQKGPVVTMYELKPVAGVKIQKISALSDDIALAMKSSSVRVVAPLPGRGTVGVEIPNEKKHMVFLREIIEDKIFRAQASKLSLAIGKDVSGNPIIADLKDMPHLLIAGTTGAGKTVCVNSLITSIMFKAKPDEVNFILVDPKMVELAPFAAIPHLIHPIISESKKAFAAFNWAVEEMERRYRLLAGAGARNIDIYNKGDNKLSYIVIVVDELADLMIVARENVETSIQRLAQLSRAVGIHLVLATQRPSVDVITGIIKANFPARISFKVSSRVDSRTVLDAIGAEKLLGKGDLLFLKPGAVKLIRAQGCFIDDEDIANLTDFAKSQGSPVYEKAIVEKEKRGAIRVESDELFDDAVKVILQSRQASASILQRRLRVGYTRAARLLDLMEQDGIVGPFCGSRAREILVDPVEHMAQKEQPA
ncbi:MAG: DNA translocase FtsK 4TM domain-containing protein [Candidatus Omnitrophota bacterium]